MTTPLFPLPLTTLEYYYWCDDSDAYPMTFPLELRFAPGMRRQQLEDALRLTLVRHPLLTSLIAGDAKHGPVWIPHDNDLPSIDWDHAQAPLGATRGDRMDLTRKPGLRVWARGDEQQTRVLLQFHHACCDGLASLQFAEDLMTHYARLGGGDLREVPLRPLDATRLFKRGSQAAPPMSWWTILRDWAVGAGLWTRFAWQSPMVLAAPSTPPAQPSTNSLDFSSQTLPAGVLSSLRRMMSHTDCTLNDLLLRDLLLTMRTWNASQGFPGGLFRINVPVSLRGRTDADLPAANALSFVFLTRRASGGMATDSFLQGIHRETETWKRWNLGLYFLGGLDLARGIPGLIPRFLRRRASLATVVLSNVGRVFARSPLPRQQGRVRCGEPVLQSVAGVPPIRRNTRASIVALNYAGQLSLHMRCDASLFERSQRDRLLRRYVDQLAQSARESESVPARPQVATEGF